MTSSNKVKGFAAGIVAAVCYGTNPLGTLELYGDGFNSSSVLIYRYLLAVLMFAVVMLFRKESFKVKWGHLIRLGVLGCMFSLSSATLYVSFHYMAAGIASTILFVYPIMTAILMTVFFHEKVTWSTSLAILLAVSGVGLLYQGDGNDKLSTAGFALVMCSSLLYALYIISINQWKNPGMSNIKFTFYILVFGLLTMFVNGIVALLHDHLHQSHRQHASRHHGSLGAGNSRHHRRMRLWREFLSAAGDRHPRYPGWRNDYHRKKERVKRLFKGKKVKK